MIKILIFLFAIILIAIASLALVPVNITDADNGKALEALRFRTIRLTLDSNPTTGYSWQVISPADSKVLRRYYSAYRPSSSKLIGAPGHEEFKFLAMAPGTTVIKIIYARAWEHQENPPKTFTLSVRVR